MSDTCTTTQLTTANVHIICMLTIFHFHFFCCLVKIVHITHEPGKVYHECVVTLTVLTTIIQPLIRCMMFMT